MPKTSGYPMARDKILSYIANNNPKELSRVNVASMLGTAVTTAGNYLSLLASEFPENLKYVRGMLLVFSSLPEARLPPETKLKIREEKIEEIRKLAKRIETNHLNHFDREKIRESIKQLVEELEKL